MLWVNCSWFRRLFSSTDQKLFKEASASRYERIILPISCSGPKTKKEKTCIVTSCPAFILSLNISHISIKRMNWRSVFTNVPCTKLTVRIRFTFVSSRPRILKVFLFNRSTSWCVSPRLFTNSMLRSDSVVAPASAVVLAYNRFLDRLDFFAEQICNNNENDDAAEINER